MTPTKFRDRDRVRDQERIKSILDDMFPVEKVKCVYPNNVLRFPTGEVQDPEMFDEDLPF